MRERLRGTIAPSALAREEELKKAVKSSRLDRLNGVPPTVQDGEGLEARHTREDQEFQEEQQIEADLQQGKLELTVHESMDRELGRLTTSHLTRADEDAR